MLLYRSEWSKVEAETKTEATHLAMHGGSVGEGVPGGHKRKSKEAWIKEHTSYLVANIDHEFLKQRGKHGEDFVQLKEKLGSVGLHSPKRSGLRCLFTRE